ncbi:MAG: ABC transporter substrate-binding protein [Thermoleophilia bacterium]|nr:ABC transporter substrate-binding protein [Thermoleophilia bacterium]
MRVPRGRARLPAVVCSVAVLAAAGGAASAPGAPARATLAAGPASPAGSAGTGEVVVGAALDLSAGWTSLGRGSRVTLRLAAADANAALRRRGAEERVRLRIVDTRGTPAGARRAVRMLARQGARIVIGPPTSSGVAAVRREAGRLGVIVISMGSTAHSLAIPGDNVFRVVPDDVRQAEAVVALLKRHQVDGVVPVWRRDPGNRGLAVSVRRLFTRTGGTVSRGVSYAETNPRFGPVTSAIVSQATALRAAGARRVAVYLAAFDEVVDLFHAAGTVTPVTSLPWYGSDGVVLSTRLQRDRRAAAFAQRVGYPSPTVGLPAAVRRRAQPFIRRARARLGREPDALALSAYDALRFGVNAQLRAGAGAGRLRAQLMRTANGYAGVTGTMRLNRAGDRAYGTYDFWSLCRAGNTARWKRTAQYVARGVGSGRMTGTGRC